MAMLLHQRLRQKFIALSSARVAISKKNRSGSTEIFIFDKKFYFWQILFLANFFYFRPKFGLSRKFLFSTKVLIFEKKFDFREKN